MARNIYDDAYVLGYASGYYKDDHSVVNSYDKEKEAQMYIKFKNGYKDGFGMRTKEILKSRGYEV